MTLGPVDEHVRCRGPGEWVWRLRYCQPEEAFRACLGMMMIFLWEAPDVCKYLKEWLSAVRTGERE
jgi:hypothetical protein